MREKEREREGGIHYAYMCVASGWDAVPMHSIPVCDENNLLYDMVSNIYQYRIFHLQYNIPFAKLGHR